MQAQRPQGLTGSALPQTPWCSCRRCTGVIVVGHTVDLPALPPAPTIPNAAVQHEGGKVGVWRIVDGDLRFTPVVLGASNLEGLVQVRQGLTQGERIVIYSEKALTAKSRIHVVERIPGVLP